MSFTVLRTDRADEKGPKYRGPVFPGFSDDAQAGVGLVRIQAQPRILLVVSQDDVVAGRCFLIRLLFEDKGFFVRAGQINSRDLHG